MFTLLFLIQTLISSSLPLTIQSYSPILWKASTKSHDSSSCKATRIEIPEETRAYFDDDSSITIRTYNHKNWKLSYMYKPPSSGNEFVPPIVLVHPVGIGLSSWFWTKVMKEYGETNEGNPALYAVDLIGCGLENGSDPWDPRKQGLFFPLSWVEGIETFIKNIVLPEYNSNQSIQRKMFQKISNQVNGCTVVVQGGLASVGILLSSRNPISFVSKLVLTSPPTYDDMVTPLSDVEVNKNYKFLTSSLCLNLGFPILESRALIRFFSDLFLFENKCDEAWLNYTMIGASFKKARAPVQAFNAGLCSTRSYEDEMSSLDQKVLVICGNGDKRNTKRMMYTTNMKNCNLKTVDGCNVLPWENERDVVSLIREFTTSQIEEMNSRAFNN
jgi:pimeloyl-ACP methyl ester carboxylesterase